MVPKVNGAPLAANIPRLTSSTRGAIPKLHGVTSLCVDAIPTNGAFMSASVRPIALIIARWGARVGPSVVSQDLCFPTDRPSSEPIWDLAATDVLSSGLWGVFCIVIE